MRQAELGISLPMNSLVVNGSGCHHIMPQQKVACGMIMSKFGKNQLHCVQMMQRVAMAVLFY